MTIYANYMAKPREKKRTCILETCSKSNNYIPNAHPRPPFIIHVHILKLTCNVYMEPDSIFEPCLKVLEFDKLHQH